MDIHIGRILRQAAVDSILASLTQRLPHTTGLDDNLLDDADTGAGYLM